MLVGRVHVISKARYLTKRQPIIKHVAYHITRLTYFVIFNQ